MCVVYVINIFMLISEYLNDKRLKTFEMNAIEDSENFDQHVKAAAQHILGDDVPEVVYTNVKKFKKNPLFSNVEYTKRGLHLFRYAFSTYAADHRTKRKEFLQQGHIKVNNFLPEQFHKLVQNECTKYPISVNKQIFNNCQRESESNPGINYLVNNSEMKKIVTECIGLDNTETTALYNQNTFVQRIENKPRDNDEQKDIHSDIFFPAVKWWYFPDEVKIGDGPFRLQTSAPMYDQLFWDWYHNQTIQLCTGQWDKSKLRGHIEGSLRARDEELSSMGITVSPMTVKANTLIVANVQLFHGRGETHYPHTRNAIHGSIRVKWPFKLT